MFSFESRERKKSTYRSKKWVKILETATEVAVQHLVLQSVHLMCVCFMSEVRDTFEANSSSNMDFRKSFRFRTYLGCLKPR
jgi:hypothetical protein